MKIFNVPKGNNELLEILKKKSNPTIQFTLFSLHKNNQWIIHWYPNSMILQLTPQRYERENFGKGRRLGSTMCRMPLASEGSDLPLIVFVLQEDLLFLVPILWWIRVRRQMPLGSPKFPNVRPVSLLVLGHRSSQREHLSLVEYRKYVLLKLECLYTSSKLSPLGRTHTLTFSSSRCAACR